MSAGLMGEIRLRVCYAKERDVGRGIARIDQGTMKKLGISVGDIIEIVGKKSTSAIAQPAYSEDQNRNIIRIDRFIRENARVAIGECVTVRPARVSDALSITLAPVDVRLFVDQDLVNFVRNRLMGMTFVKGDRMLIGISLRLVQFMVVHTDPEGVVKVTADTKFKIMEESHGMRSDSLRRKREGAKRVKPPTPKPCKVALPRAPLSPLSFPRRPTSEEISVLWNCFACEMCGVGLDPWEMKKWFEDYIANAWFSKWDDVLKTFEDVIRSIREGKRPALIYVPPIWKEPRDAVLHILAMGRVGTMDELLQTLNLYGFFLSEDDVRRIVKEEWRKPPEAKDSRLKVTPREYIKKILGVEPEDP